MVGNLLELFEKIGNLKRIKRTGWVREKIKNPESVADHLFRVAFLSMILAEKNLNLEKVLKMSLLDDVGEAIIGDVVYVRGHKIHKKIFEKKRKIETAAVKELCSKLHDRTLFRIWLELEEGKSKEAKFVKQIDYLEMALQAYEYEKVNKKNLQEFFDSTKNILKDKKLIKLFDELVKKRK